MEFVLQAIFTEATRGDVDAVRARLEKKPELMNAVASGAPKKFVGQSLLQVAIRAHQFGVAEMLIDLGADPNFKPAADSAAWTSPVLLDAVTAAVLYAHAFVENDPAADASFGVLERLLDAGADVQAVDSHGVNVLGRAVVIANDVLPKSGGSTPPVQDANLARIFDALFERGADPDQWDPLLDMKLADTYANRPVVAYLDRGRR